MNTPVKILLALIAVVGVGYVLFSSTTAASQEALDKCYNEAQTNISRITENYSPEAPGARKMCDDAFNEANTMRQCVNNVYSEHGKLQSAFARRKMSSNDPGVAIIEKHNQTCAAFPTTVIK